MSQKPDSTGDRAPTGHTRAGLSIRKLLLSDFRSHRSVEVETGPEPVVLTGPNGIGKTNLLEAISILGPGRGLRGAPFAELSCTSGEGGWAVSAEVFGPTGAVRIGTGFDLAGSQGGKNASRSIRIDGVSYRSSGALGDFVRLLWLTPAMDRLFSGPASDRRRFLDRLVLAIDPAHGRRVTSYEKAMRERNNLLAAPGTDQAWLEGIERQMAEAGVAIVAARLDSVELLATHLSAPALDQAAVFPRALLSVDGELEEAVRHTPAVEVEELYRKILYDSRVQDRMAGRALSGPHRSDLMVHHSVKNLAARQCSTGEQKALLISILLAQARIVKQTFKGHWPIMLLDEIAAHLDAARRTALFELLLKTGIQAWMSGTDSFMFEELKPHAQIFHVEETGLRAQGL